VLSGACNHLSVALLLPPDSRRSGGSLCVQNDVPVALVENSSRCHLNSDGEKVSAASPVLISRKLAMLNRKGINRRASCEPGWFADFIWGSYSRPCYTQFQILRVFIDKDPQSAIAGRKIRNIGRCMSSDVTKRSRFLWTRTMTRPGNELGAATLSFVLFGFKFYG
jgi:hypothetical protein